jgi:hypothetical protein
MRYSFEHRGRPYHKHSFGPRVWLLQCRRLRQIGIWNVLRLLAVIVRPTTDAFFGGHLANNAVLLERSSGRRQDDQ